jgi:TolA-binding protein
MNLVKFYSICLAILFLTACESEQSKREKALLEIKEAKELILKDSLSFQNHDLLAKAVATYEKFYTTYPNDSFAVKYMFEAAKFSNDIGNSEKAMQLWENIYKNYQDSKFASKSLFQCAFMQEHKLKNFDKAQELYTEFLNKYPENEMASSAELSIKYMGLPPEEVLKKIFEDSKQNASNQTTTTPNL